MLPDVRDRAVVTLDGLVLGTVDRETGTAVLAVPPTAGGTLRVLLEDQGRVNYGPRIGEPKGLLGGMLALPTEAVPAQAGWREAGSVDHVFTHFALNMRLLCADAEQRHDGIWWPIDRLAEAGLPTLFARLAVRGAEWRQAA